MYIVPMSRRNFSDHFNPKKTRERGVVKNVFFREMVKPFFFVTFNVITSHIFSENFIEIPELVLKI